MFEDARAGPVGLAAGFFDADEPRVAHVAAMWVDPARRRQGVAVALMHAVLAWSEAEGAELVPLGVIDGNVAAYELYERFGFRRTGHEVVRDRDRAVEIWMERLAGDPAT